MVMVCDILILHNMIIKNPQFKADSNTQISLRNSNIIDLKLNDDFAIKPTSDTTTALQLQKADGTNILNIDSTNGNVGIGTTSPSQELDLIGDLELEMTTSADTGVIYKGADRFIHNFQHPTGSTAPPAGQNTFIGINAGNFTMGSGATAVHHGSYNTGVGTQALYSNTTGYSNSAIGMYALRLNTTGYDNSAMGRRALYSNTTGSYNSAMGKEALFSNSTGHSNSAMGTSALYSNTTGGYNSAMGRSALYSNTTGNYNFAMGYNAGRYISGGAVANTTGDYNIFIGNDTKALADNDQNEIVIGYNATGVGSNSVVLGNDSITKTILKGNVGIGTDSPGAELQIKNSADNTAFLSGLASDDTQIFRITTNSDGDGLLILSQTTPTDTIQLHSDGNSYFNGGNVGIGTTDPTKLLSLGGESARTFWMERELTANTAGNILTITSGGATSAATDKAGGALILQGGLSTGSAESGVTIQGCVAGAAGTADRTQTTAIQVLGNKIGFYNIIPVTRQVLATGGGATVDNVITALQNLGLVSQS